MTLGWANPPGGDPLPVGGDLAGTTLTALVDGINGSPVIQALHTIYVDPNGDAASPGTNPATPTTFASAMASAASADKTTVVLAKADTPLTTGGTINITADDVTLVARTGAVQVDEVSISDDFNVTGNNFRAFGVHFSGTLTLAGNGGHLFSGCSASGGSIVRANPVGDVTIVDSDMEPMTYSATGAGSGTLILRGSSCGRASVAAGSLDAADTTFVDATLGVDASASTDVKLTQTDVVNASGVPVPITVDGTYSLAGVIYDAASSSYGTDTQVLTDYSSGIRRTLQSAGTPVTRTTNLDTTTPPGAFPYAGAVSYIVYGPVFLRAGYYRGFPQLGVQVTSQNTEFWFDVFVNGAPSELIPGENLGPVQTLIGIANAAQLVNAAPVLNITMPGMYTFDIRVAKSGGPGTVRVRRGSLELFLEVAHA